MHLPSRLILGVVFALTPASAAPRELHGLPDSMLGVWGADERSCLHADDDGRLTVKSTSMEFGVSAYELLSIVVRPNGAVRGEGLYREEGEEHTSTQVIELELLTPRQLSVRPGPGEAHVYVRCPAAG